MSYSLFKLERQNDIGKYVRSFVKGISRKALKQEVRKHGNFRTLEWAERELNPRHKDFQSFALPTELSAQNLEIKNRDFYFNLKNIMKEILIIFFPLNFYRNFYY